MPTSRRILSSSSTTLLGLSVLLVSVLGCGASAPRQPPGRAPTPTSITMEDPGGDASDPEASALLRQLEEPWGSRRDKDNQLVVPMPDPRNYKRIRYSLLDHFVGFRYGQDYHVMNVVFVQDIPKGSPNDSHTCMRQIEKWGNPQLKAFDVRIGQMSQIQEKWHDQPIAVKMVDGYVDFGFKRRRFSGAYAAYPAYPDACMVFGVAVPWGEHEDLARRVRDRWVTEGVPRLRPLTKTRPFRK